MWKEVLGRLWRALPVWGRRAIIRITQPSFTASAGVVILNEAGQILLLNHVLRPASGWGVPGGFLQAGEQPEETVRREIFEETGLELTELQFVETRTVRHHIEFLYCGRANGVAVIKSREILEARWFRIEEMPPEMSRKERRSLERALNVGAKEQI